ncbi:MAG: alpha/beta hydrolase [Dehalococcoidia bacterium]|nr:alpha/beta hydrolase [Dehalococcoidia bacterium]
MTADSSSDSAQLVEVPSDRGPITAALTLPADRHLAEVAVIVMVGGGDGGLDGPVGLYPALAEDLADAGLATLRVDFRIHHFPGPLDEGIHDVTSALAWLRAEGVTACGLLGHSFGGAVVIEAGVRDHALVRSVATLATQTAGAQRVGELAPTPLLLVHGLDDVRLSPDCSRLLYSLAGAPRELVLLEGATHSLRQRHPEVRERLVAWFARTLLAESGAGTEG